MQKWIDVFTKKYNDINLEIAFATNLTLQIISAKIGPGKQVKNLPGKQVKNLIGKVGGKIGGRRDLKIVVTALDKTDQLVKKFTKVKSMTLEPVWNETLIFNKILLKQCIKVELLRSGEELVGSYDWDLQSYVQERGKKSSGWTGEFKLKSGTGEFKGQDIIVKYECLTKNTLYKSQQHSSVDDLLKRMETPRKLAQQESNSIGIKRSFCIIKHPWTKKILETRILSDDDDPKKYTLPYSMYSSAVIFESWDDGEYWFESRRIGKYGIDKILKNKNKLLPKLATKTPKNPGGRLERKSSGKSSNRGSRGRKLNVSFLNNIEDPVISTITSLDIRCNPDINKKGIQSLCDVIIESKTLQIFGDIPVMAIKNNDKNFKSLILQNKNLRDPEIYVLAECLKLNTVLSYLNLSQNTDIDEIGAHAMGDMLNVNRTLKNIFINGDFPVDKLQSNFTSDIDLSRRKFKDVEAIIISTMLVQNSNLVSLYLFRNSIEDLGAIKISEVLKTNVTLTKLVLEWNDIGDPGAEAIAELMEINTTIRELYLEGNIYLEGGRYALENAKKNNKTCDDFYF